MKTLLGILMLYLTMPIGNGQASITICRASRTEADIDTIKTLMIIFDAVNGRLPSVEEGLNALITNPDAANLPKWRQIVEKIPNDPWSHPYQYLLLTTDSRPTFSIYSFGRDGVSHSNGNDPDDVSSWNPEPVQHLLADPRAVVIVYGFVLIVIAALVLRQAERRCHR